MAPDLHVPYGFTRHRFAAMGTDVAVLLPRLQGARAAGVETLFLRWEATLSRFDPASELSRLNARAGDPVPVSELLLRVLARALAAARSTGGLYDPGLGRQIAALGYDRTFVDVEDSQDTRRTTGFGGAWRGIRIDRRAGTVLLPPGLALDLGGIAKGMAVDAALAELRDAAVGSALVSAGGDLAVLGSLDGRPWPVAVEDARLTVELRAGALATSTRRRRRWRAGGVEQHHLLDPRTGAPAQSGLVQVTVAAKSCAVAEVAAKVALVLGLRAGAAFLERHALPGLLLWDGGSAAVGAWPAPVQAAS